VRALGRLAGVGVQPIGNAEFLLGFEQRFTGLDVFVDGRV